MKTKLTLLALALGASTCLVTAQDGPPPSDTQPPPQREGGPGGMGGQRGGPGGQGGFHLLPPFAMERLNLAAGQQKQIADLETEAKSKLEKILTPEQMERLHQMRPPPVEGGPGGASAPGNAGGTDGAQRQALEH